MRQIRKGSQLDMILAYLRNNRHISQMDAANVIGCWRLSGRIHDLRAMGYRIDTTMIYHNGKSYATYELKGEPDA